MIELIFLVLVGSNADIMAQVIEDMVFLETRVAELEEKYELMKEKKTALQLKMNELFEEYEAWKLKESRTDLNVAEAEQARYMENHVKNQWRDERNRLNDLTVEFNVLETDLENAKRDLELKTNDFEALQRLQLIKRYQNVGVTLSQTCMTMIEHGINHNCPTYRELAEQLDNTVPEISGEWEDLGYDIKRGTPMKNHWNYYDFRPNWIIFMVDPDHNFKTKNTVVEIQSKNFTTSSLFSGDTSTGDTIRTWDNFKFTQDCKKILVAPNWEDIGKALNFAMSNCYGDFEIKNTVIENNKYDNLGWEDSPSMAYREWLDNAIKQAKEYLIK